MAFWNRNPHDDGRRSRDRDRYYREEEERTGRADRDRERAYELTGRPDEDFDRAGLSGPYREREDQPGRWGGGSYYGDADYGVGPGGWRERGRAMMDDRRYRSDMPGMGARGDYGMDDSRRRDDMRDLGYGRDRYDQERMRRAEVAGGDRDRDWRDRSGGETWVRRGVNRGPEFMHGNERVHSSSLGGSLGDVGRGWGGELGNWDRPVGRGPRGYTRSDDRIREDVCDRLMQSWMNSEDVDVKVEGGEVTLHGDVDNRQEKRAIEDLVEMVLGVKEVHNHLRVRGGLKAKLGLEQKDENPYYNGTLSGVPGAASEHAVTPGSTPGSNGTPRSQPTTTTTPKTRS